MVYYEKKPNMNPICPGCKYMFDKDIPMKHKGSSDYLNLMGESMIKHTFVFPNCNETKQVYGW